MSHSLPGLSRTAGPLRLALAASTALASLASLATLGGCATAPANGGPVVVQPGSPNAVSTWNEIAVATATMPPSPGGATPSERFPGPDVVTVQLAVYDAVIAIAGTHRPFAVQPTTDPTGASAPAAAVSAAYHALKGLFPSRGEKYEAAYAKAVAELPAGDATARGLAIGREIAAGMLARRANDGRDRALPPFAAGTQPGQFRPLGPSLVGRMFPHIQSFATPGHAQFRLGPPPAVDSERHRADVDEVRTMAAANGSPRTAAQTELVRFYTEAPGPWFARNMRRFATASPDLADNARLLAMLWTAQNDAIGACFDTKYHYGFWRPTTAIQAAATGSGPPAAPWTPVVPTPNHPEYPAAHSCTNGAIAATLEAFYGTPEVTFTLDSTATGTTRTYASTAELSREVTGARVWGGMHYRHSAEAGDALGRRVAQWVAEHHFRPVD